jgi:hypothetical protein
MHIGTKAFFVPSFDNSERYTPQERKEASVMGKIVYINQEHKYFTVEWDHYGAKQRESFKFGDIGKQVTVGGRRKVDKDHNRHL